MNDNKKIRDFSLYSDSELKVLYSEISHANKIDSYVTIDNLKEETMIRTGSTLLSNMVMVSLLILTEISNRYFKKGV